METIFKHKFGALMSIHGSMMDVWIGRMFVLVLVFLCDLLTMNRNGTSTPDFPSGSFFFPQKSATQPFLVM